MNIEFGSVQELYERLKPALKSKVEELKRDGYDYLSAEDVWNYLKEKKWKSSKNLALHEMVSDIFSGDNALIDAYVKGKLNKKQRKVYFDN